MSHKSGFVTIIGRPNVGKSTLLNKILNQKIAIATDKPQTTRKQIRGVYTDDKCQIVFVDTPGVHKPLNKFGEFILDEARLAIPDTDLIIFLADASEPAGRGDKWIVDNMLQVETPILIVLNKVDLIKNMTKREENILSYKTLFEQHYPMVKVSAKTGRNIDTLIKNIYRKIPKGPKYYMEDEVTDQSMREVASEVIREKILLHTRDEIPHSVAVTIEKYEEKENLDRIIASIFVETDSQKGIVVGKGGSLVKKIGQEARLELEDIVDKKVYLDLAVKVKKDWRKDSKALKNFGYESQK